MKRWNRNWTMPVRALFTALGLVALAFMVSAVMPPANTLIGNQAGAVYTDAAGKQQTALSNQVSTTVAQIGGMDLTSSNTKSAAAGTTVYMSHTFTNTGNGSDTFKFTVADAGTHGGFGAISIFPDANGNGVPSGAALCSGATACSTGFNQLVSGNGGVFNFVVAYTIPSSANTAGLFDTATVTATATSAPGIPYAATTKTNIDTVNLTTDAAFSSTKAIAAPSVAPPLSGAAWPAALTTGKASPQSCTTDATATVWAANLVATHPTCTYTVYTINYSNTGGAAGEFTMQDPLPSGLTYVAGSAVWSGASGTALKEDGSANSNTNVISSVTSGTLKVSVKGVNPNVAGTISFVVMVNNTATVGTAVTNNIAKYYTTSCDPTVAGNTASNPCDGQTTPSTSTPPASTNSSPFPVTQTYSVIASKDGTATTPDSSTPPPKTGAEIAIQPTVAPGASVKFTDVIKNNGNGTDTFNVSVPATGTTVNAVNENSFPAGTTFAFFKADGVTPLTDTNGDGIVDTGPVDAGSAATVVMVATIPSNTAPTSTPMDVLVLATSVGSGTSPVTDGVWNEVSAVAIPAVRVDLTNTAAGGTTIDGTTTPATTAACVTGSNCDTGQGPTPNPTDTQATVPGTGAIFPIFVKNGDVTPTSYNLTATLPTGWTVKFVAGPSGTCSDAAISLPLGPLAAGAQTQVNACVTPPAGAPTGVVTNFAITATSTTNPAVTDTITDAVKTNAPVLKEMVLGPNAATGSILNGSSGVQPVLLTNPGTVACGSNTGFNVTATLDSASAAAGWSVSVYFDADASGSVTTGDPLLGAPNATTGNLTNAVAASFVPLNPGSGLPLLVKLFAPSNAAINYTATATLTVDDLSSPASAKCPSQTGVYKSVVTNGQLRLVKTEALDKTCSGTALSTAFQAGNTSFVVAPGECLIYKVVATNEGNAPVSKVVINDVAPAYTTYLAVPAGTSTCTVSGGTPTAPTFAQAAGAVSCSDAGTNGVVLNPLGTMTLQFPVKVNQ